MRAAPGRVRGAERRRRRRQNVQPRRRGNVGGYRGSYGRRFRRRVRRGRRAKRGRRVGGSKRRPRRRRRKFLKTRDVERRAVESRVSTETIRTRTPRVSHTGARRMSSVDYCSSQFPSRSPPAPLSLATSGTPSSLSVDTLSTILSTILSRCSQYDVPSRGSLTARRDRYLSAPRRVPRSSRPHRSRRLARASPETIFEWTTTTTGRMIGHPRGP